MRKYDPFIQTLICYLFIVLFIYAAVSKLMDFENFQIQLAQSPLLSAYAGFISYAVIIVEIVIALLLCYKRWRLIGLYASFGLMIAFTVYIYLILNYSDFIPCSCGGILEKLSWENHILFNLVFVIFSIIGIFIYSSNYKKIAIIKLLLGVSFSSIISVVGLFLMSEKKMKIENPFIRRYIPYAVNFQDKILLPSNGFYFAGSKGDTLFLGEKNAPLILGTIYPNFVNVLIDTLKIDDMTLPFQEIILHVDYPSFSLTDGHVPVIFEGVLPDKKAIKTFDQKSLFSKIEMVEPHRFVFRGQSIMTRENILGLLFTNPIKLTSNTKILEKQIDGVFDTDGSFAVDPITKKIIYTYFYRNEYRIIDFDLQDYGRGKTIDTISKAKLSLIKLKDGTTKMDKPPLKMNIMQVAYNGYLYNDSNSQAKLDPHDSRKDKRIIDVYHYLTNQYVYSFTIPEEGKENIREIWITSKYFYVLQDNLLIKYKRMHTPSIDK